MKIMMYTRNDPPCPYCEGAKLICSVNGYDYEQNIIGEDIMMEDFMEMYPGQRTVPLIFVTEDGFTQKIGGYQEFKKWSDQQSVKGMSL